MSDEDKSPSPPETPSSPEVLQPSPVDMIAEANVAAARLEKANAELAVLIKRQEGLRVQETLAGTADAGAPSVTKEDKDKEAARSLLAGSGFEDVVDFDGT